MDKKPGKIKWSELTYDQRINIMAKQIKRLQGNLHDVLTTVNNLGRHKHGEDGRPMVEKSVWPEDRYAEGGPPSYPYMTGPQENYPSGLEAYDFDDPEDGEQPS